MIRNFIDCVRRLGSDSRIPEKVRSQEKEARDSGMTPSMSMIERAKRMCRRISTCLALGVVMRGNPTMAASEQGKYSRRGGRARRLRRAGGRARGGEKRNGEKTREELT